MLYKKKFVRHNRTNNLQGKIENLLMRYFHISNQIRQPKVTVGGAEAEV
jgi:hypothetical protein